MLQTLKGSSAIIAMMEVSRSIWCSWFKARAATICSRKRTFSRRRTFRMAWHHHCGMLLRSEQSQDKALESNLVAGSNLQAEMLQH